MAAASERPSERRADGSRTTKCYRGQVVRSTLGRPTFAPYGLHATTAMSARHQEDDDTAYELPSIEVSETVIAWTPPG
jgi:hypothetical protein